MTNSKNGRKFSIKKIISILVVIIGIGFLINFISKSQEYGSYYYLTDINKNTIQKYEDKNKFLYISGGENKNETMYKYKLFSGVSPSIDNRFSNITVNKPKGKLKILIIKENGKTDIKEIKNKTDINLKKSDKVYIIGRYFSGSLILKK